MALTENPLCKISFVNTLKNLVFADKIAENTRKKVCKKLAEIFRKSLTYIRLCDIIMVEGFTPNIVKIFKNQGGFTMRTKRILAVFLTALMIFATSTTALANEPIIDFGGMEFTRTEFMEMFSDGAMLNGEMVTAEIFFDYFYAAQNAGRVYNTPPRNQTQQQVNQQTNQPATTPTTGTSTQHATATTPAQTPANVDEVIEDREVIPVLFEEATLLTSEELLALIETAPLHQDTRSATPIPNRRITDTELDACIEEYAELGGINAFELEVVRLINEIRAEYGLHPLAICPQISRAARFHSQEQVNFNRFTHSSPHHGGSVARMRMFGNNQGLAENVHGGTVTPERAVQGWMHSPGHRALVLNTTARTIGVGAVHSDEWDGAGRTTAKFGF